MSTKPIGARVTELERRVEELTRHDLALCQEALALRIFATAIVLEAGVDVDALISRINALAQTIQPKVRPTEKLAELVQTLRDLDAEAQAGAAPDAGQR
jgi:hypothetical protein